MDELFEYLKGFYKHDLIPFFCPNCKKKSLTLKNDTWVEHDNAARFLGEDFFDPSEFNQIVFTGIFECRNADCSSSIICSGTGKIEKKYETYLDKDGYPYASETGDYSTKYIPQYIFPTVYFFEIPEEVSDQVRKALFSAFKLLPQSPSAAANRTRTAVERILDEFEIPQHINLKKRIDLNLGNSVRLKDYADNFHALRWLGNSGSHEEDAIELESVKDAFEIIEDILKKLYPADNSLLDLKIQAINEGKGPLSYRKRRELQKTTEK
ncbi:DUF4145 domain-containing protein [Acinetobacter pittii]|uniref:DUF4145 domain-containing protein n=1 Tax=Acinetobacter pittii TaxID=48296 RepID=UPI0032612DD9